MITQKGEVVGAIGLSIKEEKPALKLIRAKTVVLATGTSNRLYPSVSPGWMFNTAFCPSCTGGAQAMAFRAGAKLVNMEFPNKHAGPKYFARAGKATWIGVLTDPQGEPVGPFVTKPTKELGDITADVWNSVFTDMYKSGRGPTYMDCTGIAEKDLKYMMNGLAHEGNTAMLKYMAEEGIDVRRRRVEFAQYEPFLIGRGVEIDLDGETDSQRFVCGRRPGGQLQGRHCRRGHVRLDRRRECGEAGKKNRSVPEDRGGACCQRACPILLEGSWRVKTDPAGRRPTWRFSRS